MVSRLKSLFNLSFENSKKVVLKRELVSDPSWEKNKFKYLSSNVNIFSRVFVALICVGGLLIASGCMFSMFTEKSEVNYLTRTSAHYIVLVSDKLHYFNKGVIILISIFLLIFILFPSLNFGVVRGEGYLLLFIFNILAILTLVPLFTGIVLGTGGVISAIILWLNLIIFGILNLVESIQGKFKKLGLEVTKNVKIKTMFLIGIGGIIIGILIGIIQEREFNVIELGILVIVYFFLILMIGTLRLHIDSVITWYYMLKYSTEYRKYYRIPDAAWYLSNRRAKKHPHIYTIGDELKEKE